MLNRKEPKEGAKPAKTLLEQASIQKMNRKKAEPRSAFSAKLALFRQSLTGAACQLTRDSQKTFRDFSISCPDFDEDLQFDRKDTPFYLENRL
ncbi:MAG: hypothetical protein DRQ24_07740 [Candidatus Latescibacterota bacterium]|nr:MAG: hypothetical protein DRQ24_07740 [Candidatus Latescibacterota bacterium]